MAYQNILVSIDEGISTLTINRPHVRHALDLATVQECHAALQALAADASVGVVIVTGAGDQAFVSGADINDIRARGLEDGLAAINSSLFSVVERFPRPTMAAVNGYALGGGCELALACDIRIAADTARFGQPEIGLGIIPSERWLARQREADVPCAPIYLLDQALTDPQVLARQFIVVLDHPVAGMVRSLGFPPHLRQGAVSYRLPPPTLGQHTDEIMADLGHNTGEVKRLRETGVI